MPWRRRSAALIVAVILGAAGGALGAMIGGPLGAFVGGGAGIIAPAVMERSRSGTYEYARAAVKRLSRWAAFEPVGFAGYLRPEANLVPFVGRESELQQLETWFSDANARLFLVVAPGGYGKTRLAMHFALRVLKDHSADALLVSTNAEVIEACVAIEAGEPMLVIVDYAETLDALPRLVSTLLSSQGTQGRLLLLARHTGAWWEKLMDDAYQRRIRLVTAPVLYLPIRPNDMRPERLARMAASYFGMRVGSASPLSIEPGFFETTSEFQPILVLHVAGLLAAIADVPRMAIPLGKEVIEELLHHEQRYWQGAATVRGVPGFGREAQRLTLAILTLKRPESHEEAVGALTRCPEFKHLARDEISAIVTWAVRLYPRAQGSLQGAIYPSTLGELVVLRELEDPKSPLLAMLSQDAHFAGDVHVDEFLAHALQDWPSLSKEVIRALVENRSRLVLTGDAVRSGLEGNVAEVVAHHLAAFLSAHPPTSGGNVVQPIDEKGGEQ